MFIEKHNNTNNDDNKTNNMNKKTTNVKFTLPVLFTLFLSFVVSKVLVQVDYHDCRMDGDELNLIINYKFQNAKTLFMDLFQFIWRASPSYKPMDNNFSPPFPAKK